MANSTPWAIISGAGPSGLLLALMLGQKGVHVHLLEKGIEIDLRPRATHYAPSAVHELQRAGIADEARARGFTPKEICWRKLDGTYLAGIDQRLLSTQESERMICLPLDKLGTLLLERIKEQPTISLKYRHRIIDVGQNAEVAWVDVETPEGKKRLEANYIIGCDGASSQIRRSLFSEFPGKTWEQQIVATNVSTHIQPSLFSTPTLWHQVYYPFEKWDYLDANFFIHPEHWHMVARISTDGMWRVSYGEIPGLSDEELIARQPMKFQKMFPGHPTADSGEYRLTNISPYKVHQRLAERMRVGRILLAADAAHCKCPMICKCAQLTIGLQYSMQPLWWYGTHRRYRGHWRPLRLPDWDI